MYHKNSVNPPLTFTIVNNSPSVYFGIILAVIAYHMTFKKSNYIHMKLMAYLISLLLLLLLTITFTVQNTMLVQLVFLNRQFESSLAMLLFLSFAVGILFSVLLLMPILIQKQRIISRLERDLENKEFEIQE